MSTGESRRRIPSTLGGMVYLVVVAITIAGLLVTALGPWRRGIAFIGAGLLLGAVSPVHCCATRTPDVASPPSAAGSTYSHSAAWAPP